jgi:hypothetical protein
MKYRLGFVSNSSSEAFICRVDMCPGEIKENLLELLNFYNKFTGGHDSFEDMFEEPRSATEEDISMLSSYYSGADEEVKGKMMIFSASDNTIPYSMFEFIEQKFDVIHRIHLG